MAEVLSQNEIDALLQAVSSGGVETEDEEGIKANTATDWIAYDITSQEKFVRGRLVALQGIHDRFSRLFRSTLTTTLKKTVSVNCTNTDFLRFSDYLTNIILPTSLNIVQIKNLKGFVVFVMGSKLTYALVDAYYGGAERPYSKIGGREEFTNIENIIVQRFCKLAMKDMEEAWRLNYPIQLEYLKSESNPHFVGSIHGSDLVAVVTFEIEFGNISGPLVVILPVRPLDAIHESLSVNVTSEVSSDSAFWLQHWMNELSQLELNLKVELGHTMKRMEEIIEFSKDDILILTQDAVAPLQACVEGVPKLSGMMGVCRGNTALRVTDFTQRVTDSELKG